MRGKVVQHQGYSHENHLMILFILHQKLHNFGIYYQPYFVWCAACSNNRLVNQEFIFLMFTFNTYSQNLWNFWNILVTNIWIFNSTLFLKALLFRGVIRSYIQNNLHFKLQIHTPLRDWNQILLLPKKLSKVMSVN